MHAFKLYTNLYLTDFNTIGFTGILFSISECLIFPPVEPVFTANIETSKFKTNTNTTNFCKTETEALERKSPIRETHPINKREIK